MGPNDRGWVAEYCIDSVLIIACRSSDSCVILYWIPHLVVFCSASVPTQAVAESELLLKAATGKWNTKCPVFLHLAGVFGWFIVSLCNDAIQIDRLAKIMRCEGREYRGSFVEYKMKLF